MRNRGSWNSLNGQGHAVSRPPAGVGANASVPRLRAVVRRNHNGQRHSGTAVAGLPEFPVSETAARAKRGSEAPNPHPTATRPQDDPRLEALRLIAWRTKKLSWTPALLALLLDELYVDDLFTEVVGDPDAIPPRDYARAWRSPSCFATVGDLTISRPLSIASVTSVHDAHEARAAARDAFRVARATTGRFDPYQRAYACTILECYSSSGLLFLPRPRRSFVHRACAARRSTSLRSSGLTLRHRAAPRPTAVR